jgi:hypothetical protein
MVNPMVLREAKLLRCYQDDEDEAGEAAKQKKAKAKKSKTAPDEEDDFASKKWCCNCRTTLFHYPFHSLQDFLFHAMHHFHFNCMVHLWPSTEISVIWYDGHCL